ncbi:MAG: Arm DNA-binding domain-containing protein, partial [Roseobacter sp.]|nr:Arm DNA-binding domain-containing protein [Roseobacter sp.]
MRSVNKLAAASLRGREPGKYEDGRGLRLVKTTVHTGKWVLRFSVSGRRREMGLGAWPEVSLAQARSYAESARATLREGIDP